MKQKSWSEDSSVHENPFETTERVGQLVRGCPSLTKVSCSSLGHAAALKLGWESFAALVVLPGSNPDLVGAPVVPDTGWFNQKRKSIWEIKLPEEKAKWKEKKKKVVDKGLLQVCQRLLILCFAEKEKKKKATHSQVKNTVEKNHLDIISHLQSSLFVSVKKWDEICGYVWFLIANCR